MLLKTQTVVFLLFFVNITIQAQTFVIKNKEGGQFPALEASVFEDKTGKMDFETIQKQKFQKNNSESFNFGYSKSVFWVKFNLRNESDYNDWRILSFIAYHDYLDFWIKDNEGKWQEVKTGWQYPFYTRPSYEHTGFVFPLDIPEGEDRAIFFRLESVSPLTFPVEILRRDKLDERFQNTNVYYGIYFGILFAMMLYNCFVFVSLRDKNYIYYVLSILCTIIVFASTNGYMFKYVFPNIPELNLYTSRLFMGFIVIPTGLFAINFLEIKQYSKRLHQIFCLVMIASIFASILTISDIWSSATNELLSIHTPLLLIAGILAWAKGDKTARFYVVAWSFYLIGGLLITLRNSGILPMNSLTTHGVEIGSALEVILLSLALGDRYRTLRKEKEEATQKALDIQKEANEKLEAKVEQRTLTLKERNEELQQMNEELDTTLHAMQLQKNELQYRNHQIQSSINYAERIQKALLPKEQALKGLFSDIFVLYRPRDIVSGDFYYVSHNNNKTILALADCTGHGVPGAFMSMMGVNLMERVFSESEFLLPNEALTKLDEYLRATFSSNKGNIRDGMDASICLIDHKSKKLWYAGAKSPLLRLRNGKITVYKKSAQSIGDERVMNLDKIPLHEIDYITEDRFFVYSDGFQDQFGGKEGKKFMRKQFRELILSTSHLPLESQKQHMNEALKNWMNVDFQKQTDDILVIGFAP